MAAPGGGVELARNVTKVLATAAGVQGKTSILALWIPVVVFAHLFAGFWLFKTWLLKSPAVRRNVKRAPTRIETLKQAVSLKVSSSLKKSTPVGPGEDVHPDQIEIPVDIPEDEVLDNLPDAPPDSTPDEVFEVLKRAETIKPLRGAASVEVSPLNMEWQGIGCSYVTPSGPKEVLADIWGNAKPGEMQALMGPSGAGKSTFMDILALRKSVGTLSGVILVNGQRATRRFVRETAYVPQEDNFVPTMTTWEVMRFYADIILPQKWSRERRNVRIKEVLAAVGLAHAHRTIVGGTLPGGLMMRGLSGGERKRLAIAVGILAAPSVLFLDEPTSGLDSFAALTVMGYMKRMALENNQVVISSIHQPRAAIWQMFDTVTLLSMGRLMYQGACEGITDWFGSLGYKFDPNLQGVPSDWALDLVAIGFTKPERFYGNTITNKEQLLEASAAFKKRYLARIGRTNDQPDVPGSNQKSGSATASHDLQPALSVGGMGEIHAQRAAAGVPKDAPGGPVQPAAGADDHAKFATGPFSQFLTLLGREFLVITRNPFDVAGRTITFAGVGILMGILFYGLPFDATSVRNRLNLLFQLLCFYCLMPYVTMGLYTADKKFYLADASSQLYRPLAYYCAKIVATTPFQIICGLVFGYTVYGMAGLRHGAEAVLKNGLISVLMYLIACQVLHASAIIAPNQDVAFMLSIGWTAIQLLLSGFFVNFVEVFNQWITWLRYISATYYSLEAVCINEFGATYLTCGNSIAPQQLEFLSSAFPNTSPVMRNQIASFLLRPAPDCVLDTKSILDYFNFNRPYWMSVVILFSYLVIFHILTFLAMLVAAKHERR